MRQLPQPQIDHRGRQWPSERAMAAGWGVSYSLFRRRRRELGWTIEQALTGRSPKLQPVQDPAGATHRSFRAMCIVAGVNPKTAFKRAKKQRSLPEVLSPGSYRSRWARIGAYLDFWQSNRRGAAV